MSCIARAYVTVAEVYNTPTPGTRGLFCVRVAGDRRLAACRFALLARSLPSAGVPVAGVPLSKGRAPWFPSAGLVRHCLINIQIYGKFADFETTASTPGNFLHLAALNLGSPAGTGNQKNFYLCILNKNLKNPA